MRILHTADWHLNNKLWRIPRQPHIVERLQEIAAYLDEYDVDVLVVAGDLFSHYTRVDGLDDALADVAQIFKPFLLRKGTIVGISGNHDNEHLFRMLRSAVDLGHPLIANQPGPRPNGRLYLVHEPSYLVLTDRAGNQVQFVLLPYPTAARYLKGTRAQYSSLEEKNRILATALLEKLNQIETQHIDSQLPSVLVSHIHVRGMNIHNLYRLTELEDVIFEPSQLPSHWAYMAFGHIHKPQRILESDHIRYSGSIERFDIGEKDDDKGVVLIDVGKSGLVETPSILPLNATPIYEIEISDPDTQLATLQDIYPETERALVKYRLVYRPGDHNPDAICRDIELIFPNWYQRQIIPQGHQPRAVTFNTPANPHNVLETVQAFLKQQLQDDPEQQDMVALAEQLFAESEDLL